MGTVAVIFAMNMYFSYTVLVFFKINIAVFSYYAPQ